MRPQPELPRTHRSSGPPHPADTGAFGRRSGTPRAAAGAPGRRGGRAPGRRSRARNLIAGHGDGGHRRSATAGRRHGLHVFAHPCSSAAARQRRRDRPTRGQVRETMNGRRAVSREGQREQSGHRAFLVDASGSMAAPATAWRPSEAPPAVAAAATPISAATRSPVDHLPRQREARRVPAADVVGAHREQATGLGSTRVARPRWPQGLLAARGRRGPGEGTRPRAPQPGGGSSPTAGQHRTAPTRWAAPGRAQRDYAGLLRAEACGRSVVVDCETSYVRLGLAARARPPALRAPCMVRRWRTPRRRRLTRPGQIVHPTAAPPDITRDNSDLMLHRAVNSSVFPTMA